MKGGLWQSNKDEGEVAKAELMGTITFMQLRKSKIDSAMVAEW